MTFWSELRSEIEKSRSDLIVGRLSREVNTFPRHDHLLYDLRTFLGPDPKVYCEIGVWQGGSSCLLFRHPYETKVVGIDTFSFPGHYEALVRNVRRNNIYGRECFYYRRNSQSDALAAELKKKGHAVDLLFIDGDHSREGVLRDFELHLPFVREGGFIVFDDYNDPSSPGVKPAVDEIAEKITSGVYPHLEVLGTAENFLGVRPAEIRQYNEFIVRKKRGRRIAVLVSAADPRSTEKTLLSLVNQFRLAGEEQPFDLYLFEGSGEESPRLLKYLRYIKKFVREPAGEGDFASSVRAAFRKHEIPPDYDFYALCEQNFELEVGCLGECLELAEKHSGGAVSAACKVDNLPLGVSEESFPGKDWGFTLLPREVFSRYMAASRSLPDFLTESGGRRLLTEKKKSAVISWDKAPPYNGNQSSRNLYAFGRFYTN